jgi:N-acetylglutamate synthase-like GNAT family acetyltransferase
MSKSGYSFYLSKWEKHQSQIVQIRESVFVRELGFTKAHISQDADPDSFHVLAYNGDGKVIGTGSLQPGGEIGQIAVLKPWRGRTVGKAILIYLLQIAKSLNLSGVWVNAREDVVRFYQSKDFQLTDQVDLIEGCNHRRMVKEIQTQAQAVIH